MKTRTNPERWLWRWVRRFFATKPRQSPLYFHLLREATDCERRARDYDLSDPYLAGVNSGRAEMLRRWASHPCSDTPNTKDEPRRH